MRAFVAFTRSSRKATPCGRTPTWMTAGRQPLEPTKPDVAPRVGGPWGRYIPCVLTSDALQSWEAKAGGTKVGARSSSSLTRDVADAARKQNPRVQASPGSGSFSCIPSHMRLMPVR